MNQADLVLGLWVAVLMVNLNKDEYNSSHNFTPRFETEELSITRFELVENRPLYIS